MAVAAGESTTERKEHENHRQTKPIRRRTRLRAGRLLNISADTCTATP
jgi:hypothetical protein